MYQEELHEIDREALKYHYYYYLKCWLVLCELLRHCKFPRCIGLN